jgi:hypothetical protein
MLNEYQVEILSMSTSLLSTVNVHIETATQCCFLSVLLMLNKRGCKPRMHLFKQTLA